jgi:hypothetical protein
MGVSLSNLVILRILAVFFDQNDSLRLTLILFSTAKIKFQKKIKWIFLKIFSDANFYRKDWN